MPPKYKVSRQLLAAFSATVAAKPNLSKEELFVKFPEFGKDENFLQAAFDYDATARSGKYDEATLVSKFPEFEFIEKKNSGAPPSVSGGTSSRSPFTKLNEAAGLGFGSVDNPNQQSVRPNIVSEKPGLTEMANAISKQNVSKKAKANTLIQVAKAIGVPIQVDIDDPNSLKKLIEHIDANKDNYTNDGEFSLDRNSIDAFDKHREQKKDKLTTEATEARGILTDYYLDLIGNDDWEQQSFIDANGTHFKYVRRLPSNSKFVAAPSKELQSAYNAEKYARLGRMAAEVMPALKPTAEKSVVDGALQAQGDMMAIGHAIEYGARSSAIMDKMREKGIPLEYLKQDEIIKSKIDELEASGLKIREMTAAAEKNGGQVGPEYAKELEAYNKQIVPIIEKYKGHKSAFDAEVAPLFAKLKETEEAAKELTYANLDYRKESLRTMLTNYLVDKVGATGSKDANMFVALPGAALLMQQFKGWDDAQIKSAIDKYKAKLTDPRDQKLLDEIWQDRHNEAFSFNQSPGVKFTESFINQFAGQGESLQRFTQWSQDKLTGQDRSGERMARDIRKGDFEQYSMAFGTGKIADALNFINLERYQDVDPDSPTFGQFITGKKEGSGASWYNAYYTMAQQTGQLAAQVLEQMSMGGFTKLKMLSKFNAAGLPLAEWELAAAARVVPNKFMNGLMGVALPAYLATYNSNLRASYDILGTSEPWKNELYAQVLSAAEGATETIFSPVEQVEGVFGKLIGEKLGYALRNLTMEQIQKQGLQKTKEMLAMAVKEGIKGVATGATNVFGEAGEEVVMKIIEHGLTAVLAPDYTQNPFFEDIKNTFITTAVGMSPLGVGASVRGVRRGLQGKLSLDAQYEIGANSAMFKEQLERVYTAGNVDEKTYNEKMANINLLKRAYEQTKKDFPGFSKQRIRPIDSQPLGVNGKNWTGKAVTVGDIDAFVSELGRMPTAGEIQTKFDMHTEDAAETLRSYYEVDARARTFNTGKKIVGEHAESDFKIDEAQFKSYMVALANEMALDTRIDAAATDDEKQQLQATKDGYTEHRKKILGGEMEIDPLTGRPYISRIAVTQDDFNPSGENKIVDQKPVEQPAAKKTDEPVKPVPPPIQILKATEKRAEYRELDRLNEEAKAANKNLREAQDRAVAAVGNRRKEAIAKADIAHAQNTLNEIEQKKAEINARVNSNGNLAPAYEAQRQDLYPAPSPGMDEDQQVEYHEAQIRALHDEYKANQDAYDARQAEIAQEKEGLREINNKRLREAYDELGPTKQFFDLYNQLKEEVGELEGDSRSTAFIAAVKEVMDWRELEMVRIRAAESAGQLTPDDFYDEWIAVENEVGRRIKIAGAVANGVAIEMPKQKKEELPTITVEVKPEKASPKKQEESNEKEGQEKGLLEPAPAEQAAPEPAPLYKNGDAVSFDLATGGQGVGEYFSDSRFPADMVAVKDGMSYRLYELATGNELTSGTGFTIQEVFDEFLAEMDRKGRVPIQLINAVYDKLYTRRGKLRKLNESPAYDNYVKKREEAEAALPYLYTGAERAKLEELLEIAINVGAKINEGFIRRYLSFKDNGTLQKVDIGFLESRIREESDENDKNAAIEKAKEEGAPVPAEYNDFVQEINEENFEKFIESSRRVQMLRKNGLYGLYYKAWAVAKARINEYGYFDKETEYLYTKLLNATGAILAKNKGRIADLPALIEEIKGLIGYTEDITPVAVEATTREEMNEAFQAVFESGTMSDLYGVMTEEWDESQDEINKLNDEINELSKQLAKNKKNKALQEEIKAKTIALNAAAAAADAQAIAWQEELLNVLAGKIEATGVETAEANVLANAIIPDFSDNRLMENTWHTPVSQAFAEILKDEQAKPVPDINKTEVEEAIEKAKEAKGNPALQDKYRVLANGIYQKYIANGKITAAEAVAILEAAGVAVPADIAKVVYSNEPEGDESDFNDEEFEITPARKVYQALKELKEKGALPKHLALPVEIYEAQIGLVTSEALTGEQFAEWEKVWLRQISRYLKKVGIEVEAEQQAGTSAAKAKYLGVQKYEGRSVSRVLPDGTKVAGRYVLVEIGGLTPSHDPHTFRTSEGQPLDENGKNPNDRDYTIQKNKEAVHQIANAYDGRATQNVFVDQSGVVLGGNNRIMSGVLANEQGTAAAFLDAILEDPEQWGFTEAQVRSILDAGRFPVVVFELAEYMPYNTETYHRFNRPEGKAESPLEAAIRLGRTVPQDFIRFVSGLLEPFDTLSDFYASKDAVKKLMQAVQHHGILSSNEIADKYDPDKQALTPTGKEFFETLMLGNVIGEDELRLLAEDGILAFRGKIIKALAPLMEIEGLPAKWRIKAFVGEAIRIQKRIVDGESIENIIKQIALFGNNGPTMQGLAIWTALKENERAGKEQNKGAFKPFLERYLNEARTAAAGQGNFFTTESMDSEKIIYDFVDKVYDKAKQKIIGHKPSKTVDQEPDAGAEEKAGEKANPLNPPISKKKPPKDDTAGFDAAANELGDLFQVGFDILAENGLASFSNVFADAIRHMGPGEVVAKFVYVNGKMILGAHYSAYNILNYIDKHGTPAEKQLAAAMRPHLPSDLTVWLVDQRDANLLGWTANEAKGAGRVNGEYIQGQDPNGDGTDSRTIAIRNDASIANFPSYVFFHELTHAATVTRINDVVSRIRKGKATPQERKDYETLLQLARNNGFLQQAGALAVKEFIAEVYSNPLLAKKLRSKGFQPKAKGFWNQFWDAIKSLLGIKPGTQLHHAFMSATKMFNGDLAPTNEIYTHRPFSTTPNTQNEYLTPNLVPYMSMEPAGTRIAIKGPNGVVVKTVDNRQQGIDYIGQRYYDDFGIVIDGYRPDGYNDRDMEAARTFNITPELEAKRLSAAITLLRESVRLGYVSFPEFVEFTAEKLSEKIEAIYPYLKKAYLSYMSEMPPEMSQMTDVQDIFRLQLNDILYVSGTNNGLESNQPDAAAPDQVGAADVQADGTEIDGGTGQARPNPLTAGGEPASSPGLLPANASIPGASSNSELDFENEQSGLETRPARNQQSGGAGISGNNRPSARQGVDTEVGKDLLSAARNIAADVARKLEAQRNAPTDVVVGDADNISDTLPFLFDYQHEDVMAIEKRFAEDTAERQYGKGFVMANGTGTGKTLTALGLIKRMVLQGKDRILIVTPGQIVNEGWVREGGLLGLKISNLKDTKDIGESRQIVTSYANFIQNEGVRKGEYDLVVFDESHNIVSNEDHSMNQRLQAFATVTNRYSEAVDKAELKFAGEQPVLMLPEGGYATQDEMDAARADYDLQYKGWQAKRKAFEPEIAAEATRLSRKTKTLFVSATPFSYHKNLMYADGYLFSVVQPIDSETYKHRGENYSERYNNFFISNFGYRIRYSKLTSPEGAVNVPLLEMEFSDRLVNDGVMIRRFLTETHVDYSRDFYLVKQGIGQEIDYYVTSMRDYKKYPKLSSFSMLWFDWLYTRRLLENIKAQDAVERIKKHLAMGRKVIVFHDYRNATNRHPFRFDISNLDVENNDEAKLISKLFEDPKLRDEITAWEAENPAAMSLDVGVLKPALETMLAAFPNAVVINGSVSNKKRLQGIAEFQDSKSDKNVVVVQTEAGGAGINLHDMEGSRPRVMIGLGMPLRPSNVIQMEGRPYRKGTQSNVTFEYPITGLMFERFSFAQGIAKKSSTVENLSMGSDARGLLDAFRDGYNDASAFDPHSGQGTGTRDKDRTMRYVSPLEKAKTYYYKMQSPKIKDEFGTDYYATPEPIGLVMANLAALQPGEKALEPSAGHGAIARWFPSTVALTAIEPVDKLRATLAMNMADSKREPKAGNFEALNMINKYDGIVMNPPFGKAGKLAMNHVEKALMQHLTEGGRAVILVPTGKMNDRLDQFLNGPDGYKFHVRQKILLPSIAFKRANTGVMTQILVIDKVTKEEHASSITYPRTFDFSEIQNINSLFEAMENVPVLPRVEIPMEFKTKKVEISAAAPLTEDEVKQPQKFYSRNSGMDMYSVAIVEKSRGKLAISKEQFENAKQVADFYNGFYSEVSWGGSIPGFHFDAAEDARNFYNAITATGSEQADVEDEERQFSTTNTVQAYRSDRRGGKLSNGIKTDFTRAGGNTVVNEDGNPMLMYHATKNEFNEFDASKRGSNTGSRNTVLGIFFTPKPENTKQFGNRLITANIYISKPLDITTPGIFTKAEQAPMIVKLLSGEKMSKANAMDWLDENIGLGEIAELYEFLHTKKTRNALIKAGYDGVISDMGAGELEYIVFEPEQIKIVEQRTFSTSEKGEFKLSRDRIIKMLLGSKLYSKPLASVALKELVQNSFDAVKAMTNKTGKMGEIAVVADRQARTITITDNGVGMTPDIVKNAFLNIGGSDKEGLTMGERSGGFGVAKVQLLLSSSRTILTTVRNGVKTTVDATPLQFLSNEFTVNTEKTKEENGTKVVLHIPEYIENESGEKSSVSMPYTTATLNDVFRAPLIGNVEVRFNGEIVPQGVNQKTDPLFTTVSFDWGTADVYISNEEKPGLYTANHKVLSAGLYQFDTVFSIGRERIPYDILINVKPSVGADSHSYPFNTSREGWSNVIVEDIKSLSNYLVKWASGKNEKKLVDKFENIVPLPAYNADKVLTPAEREKLFAEIDDTVQKNKKNREDAGKMPVEAEVAIIVSKGVVKSGTTGKTLATAAETDSQTAKVMSEEKSRSSSFSTSKEIDKVSPVNVAGIDQDKPQFHNNTNLDLYSIPGGMEYINDVGNVVLSAVRFAGQELGMEYDGLLGKTQPFFAGVSIDKEYAGVHIRKILNAIFVNPIMFPAENSEELSILLWHITRHEINHTTASGEGANFTSEFAKLDGKIARTGKYGYYEGLFRSIANRHFVTYKLLHNEFRKFSTTNVSEGLGGETILPVRPESEVRDNEENVSTGEFSGTDTVDQQGAGPDTSNDERAYSISRSNHTNLVGLTHAPGYRKAKAGDVTSAYNVVAKIYKQGKSDVLLAHPTAVIVSVHGEEATGHNAIPNAFAKAISQEYGNEVDDDIVLINRPEHTGSNAMKRLLYRPVFGGNVVEGKEYFIVDDVSTTGSSLNELRKFIVRNGGIVIGASALTGSSRSVSELTPKSLELKKLKAKFGTELLKTLNDYDIAETYEDLSASQVAFLNRFDNAYNLRNRIREEFEKEAIARFGPTMGIAQRTFSASDAIKEYEAAKRALAKKEDEIAKLNAGQTEIGGATQAGLFGMSREEIKAILDPLRKRVAEAREKAAKNQTQQDDNQLSMFNEQLSLFNPIKNEKEISTGENGKTETVQFETQRIDDYSAGADDLQRQADSGNGYNDVNTIEAIWRETGHLEFYGKTKVKSAADVAHIMRLLENKSVEHAFAVHVDAAGNSHIQFIGIGGITGAIFDPRITLAGAVRFNSVKTYFVHNHPSGSMRPSEQDRDLTVKLANLFAHIGAEVQHVIMDTYTKQYVVIDGENNTEHYTRDELSQGKRLQLHVFDGMKALTEPLGAIKSSRDIVEAIYGLRFSVMPKLGMMVLNRLNQVVANYILDGSVKGMLQKFASTPTGTAAVFYGNLPYEEAKADITGFKLALRLADTTALDYVNIKGGGDSVRKAYDYESSANDGFFEAEQEKYQTNRLSERTYNIVPLRSANQPMRILHDAAVSLEASGKTPAQISKKTGWVKDDNGNWHFDLNAAENFNLTDKSADAFFSVRPDDYVEAGIFKTRAYGNVYEFNSAQDREEWKAEFSVTKGVGIPLAQAISFEKLFNVVPSAIFWKMVFVQEPYTDAGGWVSESQQALFVNTAVTKSIRDFKTMLIHELQHIIQIETDAGYSGSSMEIAVAKARGFYEAVRAVSITYAPEKRAKIMEAMQPIRDLESSLVPALYMRATGEAEAWSAQLRYMQQFYGTRMGLSAKVKPIYENIDDVIELYNQNIQKSSLFMVDNILDGLLLEGSIDAADYAVLNEVYEGAGRPDIFDPLYGMNKLRATKRPVVEMPPGEQVNRFIESLKDIQERTLRTFSTTGGFQNAEMYEHIAELAVQYKRNGGKTYAVFNNSAASAVSIATGEKFDELASSIEFKRSSLTAFMEANMSDDARQIAKALQAYIENGKATSEQVIKEIDKALAVTGNDIVFDKVTITRASAEDVRRYVVNRENPVVFTGAKKAKKAGTFQRIDDPAFMKIVQRLAVSATTQELTSLRDFILLIQEVTGRNWLGTEREQVIKEVYEREIKTREAISQAAAGNTRVVGNLLLTIDLGGLNEFQQQAFRHLMYDPQAMEVPINETMEYFKSLIYRGAQPEDIDKALQLKLSEIKSIADHPDAKFEAVYLTLRNLNFTVAAEKSNGSQAEYYKARAEEILVSLINLSQLSGRLIKSFDLIYENLGRAGKLGRSMFVAKVVEEWTKSFNEQMNKANSVIREVQATNAEAMEELKDLTSRGMKKAARASSFISMLMNKIDKICKTY